MPISRFRFFCPHMVEDVATLAGDEARHATRVLRLRPGDAVELFDGCGMVATGTLDHVGRDEVSVRLGARRSEPRAAWQLTVASAVPKGGRLQDMVSQLVQVGVDRWVPLATQRASVHPREAKLDRLGRVVVEACRQSRRSWLMEIAAMHTLAEVLAESAELRVIAMPGDHQVPVPSADLRSAIVLIGPEGGWTDAEVDQVREAGWRPWSLGPHIMRIETAAVVAAARLRADAGGEVC